MSASTDFHIKQRYVIEFLTQNIATGDESWVHHYGPENKRQSMEYRHPGSPTVKKFKTVPPGGGEKRGGGEGGRERACSPSFGMQEHALHKISD
jgi:hypothetical protein